jgi:hypothetical protein
MIACLSIQSKVDTMEMTFLHRDGYFDVCVAVPKLLLLKIHIYDAKM